MNVQQNDKYPQPLTDLRLILVKAETQDKFVESISIPRCLYYDLLMHPEMREIFRYQRGDVTLAHIEDITGIKFRVDDGIEESDYQWLGHPIVLEFSALNELALTLYIEGGASVFD